MNPGRELVYSVMPTDSSLTEAAISPTLIEFATTPSFTVPTGRVNRLGGAKTCRRSNILAESSLMATPFCPMSPASETQVGPDTDTDTDEHPLVSLVSLISTGIPYDHPSATSQSI